MAKIARPKLDPLTCTRRRNSKAGNMINAGRLSVGMFSHWLSSPSARKPTTLRKTNSSAKMQTASLWRHLTDRAAIAAAVFDVQKRYKISDRRLIDEARVSHHTLAGLREGKRIADASLMKLFQAAEALRQEADPAAAAMDKALKDLRRLKEVVGGRNKLAKLWLHRAYIGRVLRGEKPMTEDLMKNCNPFD